MGARIRAFDWTRTSLGPPESWPPSLKTSVRIMLTSRQPIWIGWGEKLHYLYNDAYLKIVGGRHPEALGLPVREVWPELDDVIGPMLTQALAGDEGTYVESQLLIMQRHGYREETYYTFSYSPIPNDEGEASGIICANTDDTRRVIGERQLTLLRDLSASTTNVRSLEGACASAVAAFESDARDIPFAGIYLAPATTAGLAEEPSFELIAVHGIERGHPAMPSFVTGSSERALWPIRRAVELHEVLVVPVEAPEPRSGLPTGAWDEAPRYVAIVPLSASGWRGALVVGLNPFRLFDEGYHNFLSLVGSQVAASIAAVQAYEEERKRAEALAELDHAKTRFFSNVSHEFRTPLTLMLGPIEELLLRATDELTPSATRRLELVHRNGLRLLKLVNTLLDFSRIEAGRLGALYEPVDLAARTLELASTFRSAIEQAGMRLEVDCPTLSQPVYVDPDMWEKIVLNLLSNAFKFTLAGQIDVSLREAEGHAELRVRDTGVGIPAHELEHVFDRFHRVSDTRGRTHEGTGIGLALVQELVRLHEGSIRLESELDRGSEFTVCVPLGTRHLDPERVRDQPNVTSRMPEGRAFIEEALRWLPEADSGADADAWARALLPAQAGDPAAPRARVILADDNADMREYVRRLLSERFEVLAVADGQEALDAARQDPPDLVLSDVMMPRLDGFELVRALRADASLREVPIILLSARAGEDAQVEGMDSGADDYLVKPFSARELIARVHSQVRMSRVRGEIERSLREKTHELEEQDRRKDLFLGTLGHELRNPLAALDLGIRLLEEGNDGERMRRMLRRNVDQLKVIVDDLLDVSRITRGKVELHREDSELPSLVRWALDATRPTARAKSQVILDEVPESLRAHVDPARIQQVIVNLVTNAVKYSPVGGQIRVHLVREGDSAVLTVEDQGRGLREQDLSVIFEAFTQLDAGSGGLGIGLPLARALIELHGGELVAHSAGLGRGSTFRARIPCGEVSPPKHREAAKRAQLPEALRVAVVDDQRDSADSLALVLGARGAHATALYSGEDLLRRFDELAPHVVVLDIGLPGLNGFEVAEQLRRSDPERHTQLVAVTGFGDAAAEQRALAAGFERRLIKPVDIEELQGLLAERARSLGLEASS